FGNLSRNGSGDYDLDGMTDLQEFLAGTDPTVAGSSLKLLPVSYNGSSFVFNFNAVAGRTYRVSYSTTLLPGSWTMLKDVPAQGASGPVPVTDNTVAGHPTRFYRIVTPAGP